MCCYPNWQHSVWMLIPSQVEILLTSKQKYDSPAWQANNIHQYEHNFTRLPHQTTNTQLGFYMLMCWELKGFDISISINCSGNIKLRAARRQKNRITDMCVWNYKEIMRTGDIKQAFSGPSQRRKELRKSSRKCFAFAWAHLNTPSLLRWSCAMTAQC